MDALSSVGAKRVILKPEPEAPYVFNYEWKEGLTAKCVEKEVAVEVLP